MTLMLHPVHGSNRILWTLLIAAAVVTSNAAGAATQDSDSDSERTGEQLYLAACSSYHGATGRGAPPSMVGFDVPLPDFTDWRFASREPAADWMIVAHEGGPIRGFSELVPVFGGLLTMEEIGAAVEYIKGFCQDEA